MTATCPATNTNGRPCSKYAKLGKVYCHAHRTCEDSLWNRVHLLMKFVLIIFENIGEVIELIVPYVGEVVLKLIEVMCCIFVAGLYYVSTLSREEICKQLLNSTEGHDYNKVREWMQIDYFMEDPFCYVELSSRMYHLRWEQVKNWFEGFW
jgi:hypothetical protein